MGHQISKRVDMARKIVEDEISSLGYGTTSVYHLEELYGKILLLSAQIKRLEECRETLTYIVQEQEEEIANLKRPRINKAKKKRRKNGACRF